MFLALGMTSNAIAAGQKGIALVIGQSDYKSRPLPNPERDARDIGLLLDRLGFDVDIALSRNRQRLTRDIEDFVEDARDADVAILYYAGHGIEAGGENYLLPVDANLAAGDADQLVSLTQLVRQLQGSVPLVVILLDACRTSPFPPGASLAAGVEANNVTIAPTGLGAMRGVTVLDEETSGSLRNSDNLGVVISYSAAPGTAALDGSRDTNSPYAAAILKHLEAMAGQELNTVMRMVTEEVYLATGGAQRPWLNESVRRFVYLGVAPDEGEANEILDERRKLLVTISALPVAQRSRVERIAREGGVPLDALFGMLKVLESEIPQDPSELEALLSAQTQRIKALLEERRAISGGDPDLSRFVKAADQAIGQGAIGAAKRNLALAQARAAKLQGLLSETETGSGKLRESIIAVYEKSAAAEELTYDFISAATTYGKAAELVAASDKAKSQLLRIAQARALITEGKNRGSDQALRDGGAVAKEAMNLAIELGQDARGAEAAQLFGEALLDIGRKEVGTETLAQAQKMFEAVLEVRQRLYVPDEEAETRVALADTLLEIGRRQASVAILKQGQKTVPYHKIYKDPRMSAMNELLRGEIALEIGRRANSAEKAVAVFEAKIAIEQGLALVPREKYPVMWARAKITQSDVLVVDEENEDFRKGLEEAISGYRAALQETQPDSHPVQWWKAHRGLGIALKEFGQMMRSSQVLKEAKGELNTALLGIGKTPTPSMFEYRRILRFIADTETEIGIVDRDKYSLESAIHTYQLVAKSFTEKLVPFERSLVQINLARALVASHKISPRPEYLEMAVVHLREAEGRLDRQLHLETFAIATYLLADAYKELALSNKSKETFGKALTTSQTGLNETGLLGNRWSQVFIDQTIELEQLINQQ